MRLFTRHGYDFTSRFPLGVDAVTRLPAHSFLLDGEATVTIERGLAVFELIRRHRHGEDAVLIAFDLIELEGEDLRRTPIEQRNRKLAKLVRGPRYDNHAEFLDKGRPACRGQQNKPDQSKIEEDGGRESA